MNPSVLILDAEESSRDECSDVLRASGFRTLLEQAAPQALAQLERGDVDIVLADAGLAGSDDRACAELVKAIKRRHPSVDVVLMASPGKVGTATAALQWGADGWIRRPFRDEEVRVLFQLLAERQALKKENRRLREQLRAQLGFGSLIGTSPAMLQVYRLILKVAPKRHPVLILGESGTGKELAARAIHESGPASASPFVPVDCGALSPTLVESELFGHVRGAFTGATETRPGLLASAGDGAVFLDEVAELPVELQAKLLRALQEREVKPVGSNTRVPIEARVIAATNQDLKAAVKQGSFRKELYFRLNVFTIHLPPLRERKGDLPLLVRHFLTRHGGREASIRGVTPEAMARLMSYDWPGNVRELENSVQRALALGSAPHIQVQDLPSSVLNYLAAEPGAPPALTLRDAERRAILQALETTQGDRVRAAKLLKIGKTTIYRKIKEYGLSHARGSEQFAGPLGRRG